MLRSCAVVILAMGAAGEALGADHSAFDAMLRRHVTDGLVDYDAFERAPEFRAYLDQLVATDPSKLSRSDQLAFWINAYNAYTIHLINLRGERDSIRNIKAPGSPLKGPWAEPVARVGSRSYSLDEIEHQVIRNRYREPRIHFALVCAALGCPPLRAEAYDGSRIEAQLEEQARLFLLKTPEKNRVDVEKGIVYLSPIFDWFKEDFGGSDAAVLRYIARFYPEGAEKRLLLSGKATVARTGYAWKLNKRSGVAAPPYKVFEGMLGYAVDGDTARVQRSLELLGPVLTEHLDALGPAERESLLVPLGSAERRTLVAGVRRLVARDVIVLLRGLATSPPDRARTSVRAAALEWALLQPSAAQADAPAARALELRLRELTATVDAGNLAAAPAMVAAIERTLRALF